MRESEQSRFRVVVSCENHGKRVLMIDAPAALTAALLAFSEVSSDTPTVIDVPAMREVGRTSVIIEASSGRRYSMSVEDIDA